MYERLVFSGLTQSRPLPDGYGRLVRRLGADPNDPPPLEYVVTYLETSFNVEWRDLFYQASTTGSDHDGLAGPNIAPIGHYRALVNPAWESRSAQDIPGDREDAVWHIPTHSYTKVAHHEALDPLFEALSEYEDEVFGTVRLRREGGEINLDVFFAESGVQELADGEEAVAGVSTGNDYYGNVRLFVDYIAYHRTGDGVGQVMRHLVDPRRRKHSGAAADVVAEWYGQSIERIDRVTDKLHNIVYSAMQYEVPLGDLPCTIEGFYEHLGLPNRAPAELAGPAATRAIETAVGPYTAWHLYKAGMWSIEHNYESRDTSSFKSNVNAVNTLLYNPSLAERRVLRSIEETLQEADDSHSIFEYIDGEVTGTLEQVRKRAKTVEDGVEEEKGRRKRFQSLLQDEPVVEEAEPVEAG